VTTRAVVADVWWFDLGALAWPDRQLEATLSYEERTRADRFHFSRDRQRFVRRRGALRNLLGSALGAQPAAVMLHTDANGRPRLAPEQGSRLRFNQSSSGDVAVCATTTDCDVGVDVEQLRDDFDVDDLARRFFSASEVTQLQSRKGPARTAAFFSCWTSKEAFVKARGDGLRLPLDQFDIDLHLPTATASSLVATRWEPSEVTSWCVRPLSAPAGYVAAVAIAAPCSSVTVDVATP
jgi:4'-phosphopantetheinyl transferase